MLCWAVRLLALAALAVSVYLAWVSLRAGEARIGCGGLPQFDCDHVLGSRWSVWLGVPVGVPAAAIYAAIFAASCLIGSKAPPWLRRAAWRVLIMLAITAAGAALWFLALLLSVIKGLCLYCAIVHGCGLTIAGLLLTHIPITRRRKAGEEGACRFDATGMSVAGVWSFGVLGLAGVAMLIVGQMMFPPDQFRFEPLAKVVTKQPVPDSTDDPAPGTPRRLDHLAAEDSHRREAREDGSHSPQDSHGEGSEIREPVPVPPTPRPKRDDIDVVDVSRTPENGAASADEPGHLDLSIVDGEVVVDAHMHPILGSPDAEYIVVKLFDYTCRDCRTLHQYLLEARRRYGNQFAVVVVPVPMNSKCNKHISYTHPDQEDACRYAKLALAVWQIVPSKFEGFHNWLFASRRLPGVWEATDRAAQFVARERLVKECKGPLVAQQIRRYTQFHQLAGGRSVPKILAGKWVISGKAASAQEICGLLERALGIEPIER